MKIMQIAAEQAALEAEQQKLALYQSVVAREVVSTEGLLDVLKTIFGKPPEKMSEAEWAAIWYRGIKGVEQKLKNTLANEAWVKDHYQAGKPVKLSVINLSELIVDGKLVSPPQAVEARKRAFEKLYSRLHAPLEKYADELLKAEDAIESFFHKQASKDADAVKAFALSQMKQVSVPEPADLKPYWKEVQGRGQIASKLADQPLPALSQDDVSQVGKALLGYIPFLEKMEKAKWRRCGSDYELDFWSDYRDYNGEMLRTGEVGKFFYHQAMPEHVANQLTLPLSGVGRAWRVTLLWLLHLTGDEV